MASQRWLNRLREALRRQGLPDDYVDRLVEELSDHAADLVMEEQSMEAEQVIEARLGAPGQLAAVARREFQRRTFAGRHPALTFLAGPPIVVIGSFLASLLLLAAGLWLLDIALGLTLGSSLQTNDEANLPPSEFEMGLMRAGELVVRFVPFALSAWIFVLLGRRCARPIWSAVACGLVAAAAFCFWSVIEPPGTHADKLGTWMMSFGWPGFGLGRALQAIIPLAFAAWMLWPAGSQRKLASA